MLKNSSETLFVPDRGRSETKNKGQDKNKNKSRSKSRGGAKTCWICGKEGHYKKQCYVWKERNKNDSSSERGEASAVRENEVAVTTLMVSDATCLTSEDSNATWILDTGCTFHMCPKKDLFETLSLSECGSVKMANDTVSRVKGIGTVLI